ncbi:hypothetical protein F5Y10DRAFT_282785 [Nemania abortiva]|nr:hypothetical protein F5Y10DRAFT_282785 [Nemania abortiva]
MASTQGQVRFLKRLDKWITEKPFFTFSRPNRNEDPEHLTNLEFQTETVEIQDVRGLIANFRIDECGFQVVHHPPAVVEFATLDHIAEYQKDVQTVLTKLFGAEHVLVWDFRRRKPHRTKLVFDINNKLEIDTTVKDYTFISGPIVIKSQLVANGLERYLCPGYRFRMVNFWRSLLPIVESEPLALCDFRSVEPADVVACDRIRPDRTGEAFYLHHNRNQRWHYLSSMTRDEAWAFVTYDSAAGNLCLVVCPHSSFVSPVADVNLPARYSAETRAIVITKT